MSERGVRQDAVEGEGVAGRVVIVTGAGQGIGRGMALHLGKHGASIVVAEGKGSSVWRGLGFVECAAAGRPP